jgi:MFS family permease
MSRIEMRLDALKTTKPHEYAVRFVFGGLATVAAGLIAHRYGAVVGGLFLAFPAIFPASATLISSHERERKAKAGKNGTLRGRMAAGADAAGGALGSIGLIGFALVLWLAVVRWPAALVLALAVLAWAALAFGCWMVRKSRMLPHRRHAATDARDCARLHG